MNKELLVAAAYTFGAVFLATVAAHAVNEYVMKPHAEKTLAAK